MSFGAVLRACRERRGLSQGDVAKRAKVDYQRLGEWERGIRNPTLPNAFAVARGLGVPLASLVAEWELGQVQADPAQAESVQGDLTQAVSGAENTTGPEAPDPRETVPMPWQHVHQDLLFGLAMLPAAVQVEILERVVVPAIAKYRGPQPPDPGPADTPSKRAKSRRSSE